MFRPQTVIIMCQEYEPKIVKAYMPLAEIFWAVAFLLTLVLVLKLI
jgi:hypothetical protein